MTKEAQIFREYVRENLIINKTQCADLKFASRHMAVQHKKTGILNGLTVEEAAEIIESEIQMRINNANLK